MGDRDSGVQGGEQAGPAPPSQAQLAQAQRNKEENEDTTLDDSKFDEFMGNDAGALANTGEYDQDDKDADDVWSQIDSHMDNRRSGPPLPSALKPIRFAGSCSSQALQSATHRLPHRKLRCCLQRHATHHKLIC